MDVNRFFLLESINVTRNVEVVVVFGYLLQGGKVAVFLNLLAITVGVNNLLNMLWAELVLCLYLLKILAGINEENTVVFLTAFLKHQNTGRDACSIEDVGR